MSLRHIKKSWSQKCKNTAIWVCISAGNCGGKGAEVPTQFSAHQHLVAISGTAPARKSAWLHLSAVMVSAHFVGFAGWFGNGDKEIKTSTILYFNFIYNHLNIETLNAPLSAHQGDFIFVSNHLVLCTHKTIRIIIMYTLYFLLLCRSSLICFKNPTFNILRCRCLHAAALILFKQLSCRVRKNSVLVCVQSEIIRS